MGVWDLNYTAGSTANNGGLIDSVGDFLGSGDSGEAVDDSVAATTKGLTASLLDVLGVDANSGSSSGGSGGSNGSGGSGGSDSMQLPSWAAPVGVLALVLLVIQAAFS